jgi:hypothetical protein
VNLCARFSQPCRRWRTGARASDTRRATRSGYAMTPNGEPSWSESCPQEFPRQAHPDYQQWFDRSWTPDDIVQMSK